jgi:K+/H+ antiporter YhaU regulatory subunit KhtT
MESDSGLDFVVDDLPGIGRRYEMTGSNGGRITVIVHHSGRRVVYGRNADSDQASAVELSDHQARKLGAILGGAFFKPAVVEEVEAVFDDLLIEWVALEPNSPGAAKGSVASGRRVACRRGALPRDQIAKTSSSNAAAIRRLAGSSTASS